VEPQKTNQPPNKQNITPTRTFDTMRRAKSSASESSSRKKRKSSSDLTSISTSSSSPQYQLTPTQVGK